MTPTTPTAASSSLGRVVYARLLPGSDLMGGIREVAAKHGIRNGVILCCMGSLERAVFEYGRASRNLASQEPLEVPGPVSLLACQGVVCPSEPDGHLAVHLHGSVQGADGQVIGQHFADSGNTVFNTVDLVVADLGIELVRTYDDVIKAPVTTVKGHVRAEGRVDAP